MAKKAAKKIGKGKIIPMSERAVISFRLPPKDKEKITTVLEKAGETWQSAMEPLAYQFLLGEKPANPLQKNKAIDDRVRDSIEHLEKVIVKLKHLRHGKGYR